MMNRRVLRRGTAELTARNCENMHGQRYDAHDVVDEMTYIQTPAGFAVRKGGVLSGSTKTYSTVPEYTPKLNYKNSISSESAKSFHSFIFCDARQSLVGFDFLRPCPWFVPG